MVHADPRLMQAVMENLLSNAWKFTRRAEEPLIEVGSLDDTGEHPEERVFYVRDNGAGFDMSYADKLWQAFQRLHDAREFEGTGIGLASVKRVVDRHGGTIWAEGVDGEGATFYFTIPAGAARLVPESLPPAPGDDGP